MKLLKNLTIVCGLALTQASYGMSFRMAEGDIEFTTAEKNDVRLIKAAEKYGDIKTVEELLKRGVNINEKNVHGKTALMYATSNGDEKMVEFLLKHGAKVNEKDKISGRTELMRASQKPIIKLLLEHGAKIDEKDPEGRTALMHALLEGRKEAVELLLEHGANINEKDKNGMSVLMYSTIKGHLDIFKLLLEHGAKIDDKDKNGWTPLMYAVRGGLGEDKAKLLLEQGAKIDEKNDRGKTALMIAADQVREIFQEYQEDAARGYRREFPKFYTDAINFLLLFSDKANLKVFSLQYGILLSQDMQDFIDWILGGSQQTSLDENNAPRFAQISFAMPHFTREFEMAFNFLVENNIDYSKIFTDKIIQNALLTQNIKTLEILIKQAEKDEHYDLIKAISAQVRDTNRTKFNAQFIDNLSNLVQDVEDNKIQFQCIVS